MIRPTFRTRRLVRKFFSNIRVEHHLVAEFKMHTPCWVWMGRPGHGYPLFSFYGTRVNAHAFAFHTLRSPHPRHKGRILHHRCRNKMCVNPEHLQMVTRAVHPRYHPQHRVRDSKGRYLPWLFLPITDQGRSKRRKRDRQLAANRERPYL